MRKTFIDLVKINESSGRERKIVDYISRRLTRLKIPVIIDPFGNLIAKIGGEGKPVVLSTHMDIPEPMKSYRFIQEKNIIRADGNSILGADPKSGLAVLLELVERIGNKTFKTRPIELVFTKQEEQGLVGAKNLDYSKISAKEGLVMDESGPCTKVVIRAPTFLKALIKIRGKTAHVSEPEKGVNALEVAAAAISKLKLGYISPGVTFNIGIFRAGTAANSVPGEAEMEIDMRSFDDRKLKESMNKVRNRFEAEAANLGAKLKIEESIGYFGYKIRHGSKFIRKLKRVYSLVGLRPEFITTYGGSDANVFNRNGIACVPIGSGYYNPHQYNEYVNLQDMETLVKFLTEYVKP